VPDRMAGELLGVSALHRQHPQMALRRLLRTGWRHPCPDRISPARVEQRAGAGGPLVDRQQGQRHPTQANAPREGLPPVGRQAGLLHRVPADDAVGDERRQPGDQRLGSVPPGRGRRAVGAGRAVAAGRTARPPWRRPGSSRPGWSGSPGRPWPAPGTAVRTACRSAARASRGPTAAHGQPERQDEHRLPGQRRADRHSQRGGRAEDGYRCGHWCFSCNCSR
jgi:hypothetical protein